MEDNMFRLVNKNNLSYYVIDSFEETGLVKHCFTTREGGVSRDEFSSLNLRFNCDDKRENVLKNYKIICDAIGVDYKNLVISKQVHEDNICRVTSADCGNGITKENRFTSADGLICSEPGVPIATLYADCVPLYFLDVKNRIIAESHSGWKGTVKNISSKTVEKMVNDYNSKPENILAAIGPSIGECHFEVGDEVAEEFLRLPYGSVKKYGEKYHVNLQETIEKQLLSAGISKKNLTVAGICTYCSSDLLFSHRKTKGKRGNMAAIMELV
ncbi:MAG: peptidoglycan editing factor PgeF [Clostridia bacterium]|nr:peptidoglycan editing factor PgeF [Clostridia bacterium]